MAARITSGSTGPASTERVLVPVDETHLLSMQMALDAHGIRHTAYPHHTDGMAKYSQYITVDAVDFDRAVAAVSELQVTTPQAAPWNHRRFRLFVAVTTLLVFAVVLLLLFGPHD